MMGNEERVALQIRRIAESVEKEARDRRAFWLVFWLAVLLGACFWTFFAVWLLS
jgi:hypothetical protein